LRKNNLGLTSDRLWRIEYEDAIYHPVSWGNDGNDIFIDKKDHVKSLDMIGDMSERYDLEIFA
jgi:hypothetical protein